VLLQDVTSLTIVIVWYLGRCCRGIASDSVWLVRNIRPQKPKVSFQVGYYKVRSSGRCRVEMWRGSSRFGLSVVRPFRLAVP
jgi:hypothetical protein